MGQFYLFYDAHWDTVLVSDREHKNVPCVPLDLTAGSDTPTVQHIMAKVTEGCDFVLRLFVAYFVPDGDELVVFLSKKTHGPERREAQDKSFVHWVGGGHTRVLGGTTPTNKNLDIKLKMSRVDASILQMEGYQLVPYDDYNPNTSFGDLLD